jgi:ribosome-associated protein
MTTPTFSHNDEIQPTRAELKRRMDRLQDLGKRLTELPAGKLARIDLPDKLRDAVVEARRLTALGAKRRQLQYIGRIMEEFDATAIVRELRDIDLPLKPVQKVPNDKSPAMIMAEALLEGGDEMIHNSYSETLNRSDIQQIRQALRQSIKNLSSGADRTAELLKLAKVCSQFIGG